MNVVEQSAGTEPILEIDGDGLNALLVERLDDANTVGRVREIEPGENTASGGAESDDMAERIQDLSGLVWLSVHENEVSVSKSEPIIVGDASAVVQAVARVEQVETALAQVEGELAVHVDSTGEIALASGTEGVYLTGFPDGEDAARRCRGVSA